MGSKTLYMGECIGGPMHGQEGQSRFPKGFILVNAPDEQVVVYDRKEDGNFVARQPDRLNNDKASEAAASVDWDVRAYDPEVMG